MKKFILKVLIFLLPIVLFFALGLLLPATPRAAKSMLMAEIKKDSLLVNTDTPRIIFVGGSNLSFGLNSQMIKDSFNINPINTSLHAGLGLKYMMRNTLQYIKEGDIVVLVSEYHLFFKDVNSTSPELLRMAFDVNKKKILLFDFYQMIDFLQYVPQYVLTKFKIKEYKDTIEDEIYGVNSYNKYGDTFKHWNKERQGANLFVVKGNFNEDVVKEIKKFENCLIKKGATLFVSYPCYQEESFRTSIDRIKEVEEAIKKYNFKILGNPERYMMNDSLIFNSAYHLNKQGVDLRTELLIEYLKNSEINK